MIHVHSIVYFWGKVHTKKRLSLLQSQNKIGIYTMDMPPSWSRKHFSPHANMQFSFLVGDTNSRAELEKLTYLVLVLIIIRTMVLHLELMIKSSGSP